MSQTENLLDKYRKCAFFKLEVENDEHKITYDERIKLLFKLTELNLSNLIQNQIDRDIEEYPLYDSLAMWLDKRYGLAYWHPEEMIKLARLFL